MTWLTITEYMCHTWPRICSPSRKHLSFPHSWLITGFVTRVILRVPLVMQELLTLCGVRFARSLVLCVMFCRSLFVLFSFFVWSLCCLFFFDLRNLITTLVSSNSSCSFFLFAIVFPVLLFTESDYPFGIFKLLLFYCLICCLDTEREEIVHLSSSRFVIFSNLKMIIHVSSL